MNFTDLNINADILKSLNYKGYTEPTPIQERAIPFVLEGRDLFGCAQTGTGKTAAFAIPTIQNILPLIRKEKGRKQIKALVLTPTRELALQVSESFEEYGKFTGVKQTVIFGGVPQSHQVSKLKHGVDVLVATPGRLLDLMNQGLIDLRHIAIFILDEADTMLDMGFIRDINKIIPRLPEKRQTLFFSATFPPEILKLADNLLKNPASVTVKAVQKTTDQIEQGLYYVEKSDKRHLLKHLLKRPELEHVLIFTRTKHGANRVAKDLAKWGIKSAAIHSEKSQNARQNALSAFKKREISALVATDIAARGIDIAELSHVINFDIPNIPETYVHRVGRTGRASATGIALSFCDSSEKTYVKSIERIMNKKIPLLELPIFERPVEDLSGGQPRGQSGQSKQSGQVAQPKQPWQGNKQGQKSTAASFGKKRPYPTSKKKGAASQGNR